MAPRVPILLAVAMAYPVTALGYGETTEDRPNAHERAVHFFTDQLRVDPGAHDSEFDREPLRPLAYNPDLNDAARFYADDLATNGCFPEDHSSCDGTSAADRITSFYGGPGWAENIALGSPDAWSVVYDGWLYSAGHRRNMLDGDLQELGTGFSSGDAGRLWVQDFGFGTAEVEPTRATTRASKWLYTTQLETPSSPRRSISTAPAGVWISTWAATAWRRGRGRSPCPKSRSACPTSSRRPPPRGRRSSTRRRAR